MLKAHGLSIHRGGRQILADIDLALPAGQVTGVLGANGTGKSSLLAVLAGELRASAGTVTLHDQPLSAWPAAALARWRAVLPQSPSLQFDLPVETVIGMGSYPHVQGRAARPPSAERKMLAVQPLAARISAPGSRTLSAAGDTNAHAGACAPAGIAVVSGNMFATGAGDALTTEATTVAGDSPAARAMAADEAVLRKVLALADVGHLYDRRYRQLSGGEQQRVQFARVLHQLLLARSGPDEYRVLMLDEPTASLDPHHQLTLLSAVRRLAHEENIAALVILHDVNLAAGCCDRLLLIGEGRAVAFGTPSAVLTPGTLRAVYGVEALVMPHPVHPERPLVVF